VLPFRGAGKPSNYWRAYRRLSGLLSEGHYDLIHGQFGQSGLLAVCQRRVPTVVTYRGSDLQGIPRANGRCTLVGYLLCVLSQLVAHLADEVIIVSEHLADYLPRRRYHVIPSGIDLDLFLPMSQDEARSHLGLPLDGRLVLFVGSPRNPRKRHDLAQQAMVLLDRRLSVRLVVAAGLPYEQMPLYMNACDALLLTSFHEGSPNAVKEALACNLPVVSVDVGDVRQRIGSVEGCMICPDDRAETLAAALAQVLERRERVNGQAAVQDLDERLLTRKVIAVYEMALARREMQR